MRFAPDNRPHRNVEKRFFDGSSVLRVFAPEPWKSANPDLE